MSEMRVVTAGHGVSGRKGYQFRCRVVPHCSSIFTKKVKWRFVIEYHFVSWGDYRFGTYAKTKGFKTALEARSAANEWLDEAEATPKGAYV